MEWSQLQWLLPLAEQGTVASAARILTVAPSTLYRRLDQLEEELGLTLFHRDQGQLRPTEAGRATVAAAGEVAHRVARLERELEALRDGQGRVVLAAPEAMALLLMGRLARFHALHPETTVQVVVSQGFAALARGEADVALRVSDAPGDELVGRRVGPIQIAVYGRDGADGPFDLAAHDWVCFDPSLADTGQGRWEAQHVPQDRVRMRVGSRTLFLEAVKAGVGVGLLPCALAERHGLVRHTPKRSPEGLTLWVLCDPAVKDVPAVRALMSFLVDELLAG